jgi:Spy/CpxP family protein refolding chaperone
MKLVRIAPISLFVASVLLTGMATAQGPGPRRGGDFLGPRMMDMLDLSDAQQTQIKQIYQSGKASLKPLWTQERESHMAMMKLVTSGAFDPAKATTIATQESQVRAQLEVEHAKLAAQAYEVLTTDQKNKLNEFLAKREQRAQQHMMEHSAPSPE